MYETNKFLGKEIFKIQEKIFRICKKIKRIK